ncbi:MAG TPA: DnaJ domain-containing protein [Anaerolineae bacterium]|nr:DnaJ domain-containing protein [Anaerolineae bacterium]HMR66341.1 DnaJ domain-containing protein [Anaerolineae bacterium]
MDQSANLEKHFQILGLAPNASPRRVKERYRELAKQYHPDRQTDPALKAESARQFQAVSQAYHALEAIVQQTHLSLHERKLNFLYDQGKKLCEQQNWSQALIVLTELVALEAGFRDTLTLLREARRKQRELSSLYQEANALLQQGQWSAAEERFASLSRQAPGYRDASKKRRQAQRELLMQQFLEVG